MLYVFCIYALFFAFQAPTYQNNKTVMAANTNNKISDNELIIDKNDKTTHQISINPMQEYDYKTKKEIWKLRNSYAKKYPKFIKKDYSPTPRLFDGIVDGKPWWDIDGIVCQGNTEHSIDGYTRLSMIINNPMVLISLIDILALRDGENNFCHNEWPKITSFTVNPSKKTFDITYDVTSFFLGRKPGYFYRNRFHHAFFLLADLNARDFGYEYGNIKEYENISFEKDCTNKIVEFEEFLATGNSCNQPNGCNNIGPSRPTFGFKFNRLPAHVTIHLYKDNPKNANATPDIIFKMHFI